MNAQVDISARAGTGRAPAPLLLSCPVTASTRERIIREEAYYRWAYRGCIPGRSLDDWLAAERKVDSLIAQREKMIREAAYYRWKASGCLAGCELEDWLAAEHQIDDVLLRRGMRVRLSQLMVA